MASGRRQASSSKGLPLTPIPEWSLSGRGAQGLPHNQHSLDAHSLIQRSPIPGGPSWLLWVAVAPCQDAEMLFG